MMRLTSMWAYNEPKSSDSLWHILRLVGSHMMATGNNHGCLWHIHKIQIVASLVTTTGIRVALKFEN